MSTAHVIGQWAKNQKEQFRVALDQYQGHKLLDLRVMVQLTETSGVWSPTKKGVSLGVRHIDQLIEALQEARRQALALGYMSEAGQ